MSIKLNGNYWIDEYNNQWNIIEYSEERALEHSATLKNCINCIDCYKCIDCDNCIYCYECIKCNNCKDCLYCENHSDLVQCNNGMSYGYIV